MRRLNRSRLDALVFDFDGVLTDNRVIVFEDGREAVICNRADGLAFDYLRRVGMPAYILSRETNPVVAARGKKLGVPVYAGVMDKAEAMQRLCTENGFDLARMMFVGNDVNDLEAMGSVGYPIAVADAHPAVCAKARHVLRSGGGEGVVREVVETLVTFAEPFDRVMTGH